MIQPLLDWDRTGFVLLNQSLVHPWLDWVMTGVTSGRVLQYLVVALFAAGFCIFRQKALPIVLGVLSAIAISNSASDVVKSTVDRPRPFITEGETRLLVGRGRVASFPSSHAANGAAAAVALAMLVGVGTWWRALTVCSVFGLIGLVGWSRVYVGVHFPSDVLVGWILGALSGGVSGWMWLRMPPLRVVGGRIVPRISLFNLAVLTSVLLAVFRLGSSASNDQGLTPGEAVVWYAARHPLMDLGGALGPTPPFMTLIASAIGAIGSFEPFALRWIMPVVGLVVILGVLYLLVLIGMTRSMAGLVVLFLQTVPAVNACHYWFTENTFNGLPWTMALIGWALWTLHGRAAGVAILAGAMVLTLTDPRSFLLVGTSLWLLEHFRGNFVSRRATLKSLVVGLALLAGCLAYRFSQPDSLAESLWAWNGFSAAMAAGPGTWLLLVAALGYVAAALCRARQWRLEILGIRRRILLLYCAGTALASIWLGSKSHVTSVVTLVVPGVIMISQIPLLFHLSKRSGRRPAQWFLAALVVVPLAANSASLMFVYDKATVRRLPGDLVLARWTTGWPDRTAALGAALAETDRLVATDAMTAAALSHALGRPVGLASAPSPGAALPLPTVQWVDGTTTTLFREILVKAPWSKPLWFDPLTVPSAEGSLPWLVPLREGPSVLALDRPKTTLLEVYEFRNRRPTAASGNAGGEAQIMEPLAADPVDL